MKRDTRGGKIASQDAKIKAALLLSIRLSDLVVVSAARTHTQAKWIPAVKGCTDDLKSWKSSRASEEAKCSQDPGLLI